PMIRRSTIPHWSRHCGRIVSISARSARGGPTPSGLSGSPPKGLARTSWRVSAVRSASISAPCRTPRSPSRSSARSPPCCAAATGSAAMRFGEVAVGDATGAILVHSLRLGATALKKGRVLSPADIAAIAGGGIDRITVVRLDPDDVREDAAAARVAAAAAGANIAGAAAFTGRANLFAEAKGLLVFDRDRLDRFNLVDEAVTLGTLPLYSAVEP